MGGQRGTLRPVRCVVVGGGLAGLASAVWLAEAGHEVVLLERRGALGGRTVAMPQDQVDDVPDNGQHVLASGYTHLPRFLRSIGTADLLAFPGHLTIRMPDGTARRIGSGPLGVLRVVVGDVPGVRGWDRFRTAVAQARLIGQALRQPRDLDAITAEEWFDRVGLPETARVGLWNTVVIGLTGDKPSISSAKVPAELLVTGLRQAVRTRRAISIGYPTVDLGSLIVRPASAAFDRLGVSVRTRAVVRGLEVEAGPAGRRVVRGVRLSDGEVVAADAVVCAVPIWDMADLLEGLPEAQVVDRVVAELTPVPIVSVNLYLDRDIGMADWGEVVHGGEGVLEQVWDRQRMHGRTPRRSWLFSTTVSAAYELVGMRNDEIVAAQMAVLADRYPAAAEAAVVHAHVVRMPRSTFAQRPGTAGLRPPQATSVEGLVLAGDWTRTDWTTTMEGACQSAARAVAVLTGSATRRRPRVGGQ